MLVYKMEILFLHKQNIIQEKLIKKLFLEDSKKPREITVAFHIWYKDK